MNASCCGVQWNAKPAKDLSACTARFPTIWWCGGVGAGNRAVCKTRVKNRAAFRRHREPPLC